MVENRDGGFLSQHLESRLEENLFDIIQPQDIPVAEEGESLPMVILILLAWRALCTSLCVNQSWEESLTNAIF